MLVQPSVETPSGTPYSAQSDAVEAARTSSLSTLNPPQLLVLDPRVGGGQVIFVLRKTRSNNKYTVERGSLPPSLLPFPLPPHPIPQPLAPPLPPDERSSAKSDFQNSVVKGPMYRVCS